MALKFECKRPTQLVGQKILQKIHDHSLELLSEAGLCLQDDQALQLLAENGCDIDLEKQIAKFPPELIEQALKDSPKEFTLRSRDAAHHIQFKKNIVQFGPCCGMKVMDPLTDTMRPGLFGDVEEVARLCEMTDIMAGANAGLGYMEDCPHETNLVCMYYATIRNTSKVFSLGAMDDSVKWGIRMAQVMDQDVIVPVTSSSPLGWDGEQIDAVRRATKAGLPIAMQSMASPGTTAPVSLIGAAVVMNTEILGLLTLAQLFRPGTGVMYSCFNLPLDMRKATLASGSMELAMLTGLSAQMAQFYETGSMIWGPMTDSKSYDEQAGYEKGMGWLLAAMAGINLIWGAGMIENHTIWSHGQLLVDAEICQLVGRYLDGVNVSDDAFALNEIKNIGHFPNNYLASKHTLEWFKKDHFFPELSSRDNYERWIKQDDRELLHRAQKKAVDMLKNHEPVYIPPEKDRELKRLLDAAAKEKGLNSPFS
jgi:trimethylamine---corrinoid protein Co-methyltransferase